jgi:hypothetical protein
MEKVITIKVESEKQMTMVKALMLSLDISFKIQDEYPNAAELNNKRSDAKPFNLYSNNR